MIIGKQTIDAERKSIRRQAVVLNCVRKMMIQIISGSRQDEKLQSGEVVER
jgi:hypothetical protein